MFNVLFLCVEGQKVRFTEIVRRALAAECFHLRILPVIVCFGSYPGLLGCDAVMEALVSYHIAARRLYPEDDDDDDDDLNLDHRENLKSRLDC